MGRNTDDIAAVTTKQTPFSPVSSVNAALPLLTHPRLLKKERLRLICPIDGTESEFEPYPAFGLACETVDFAAEKLED